MRAGILVCAVALLLSQQPLSDPAIADQPKGNSDTQKFLAPPPVAQRMHQSGTVIVDVFVNDSGHVGDVELATSSGFPQLDAAALLDAPNWQFGFSEKAGAWHRISAVFPPADSAQPSEPTKFDDILLTVPGPQAGLVLPKMDPASLPRAYFPPLARRKGEQGAIVVEYVIGTDGWVQDDRIIQSSGYPLLDAQALISAGALHFFGPVMKDGMPVPARGHIVITFKLN